MGFPFTGSPVKDDESSLDIYAGLDSGSTFPESSCKSSPPRDCFDLYEEVLTEEQAARDASHQELQKEFQACKKQLEQLMKQHQELQTQNFGLQNENTSLKKNISALIKTARLEIVRKDEEIGRLTRRLSGGKFAYPGIRPRYNPPPSVATVTVSTASSTEGIQNHSKFNPCPLKTANLDDAPLLGSVQEQNLSFKDTKSSDGFEQNGMLTVQEGKTLIPYMTPKSSCEESSNRSPNKQHVQSRLLNLASAKSVVYCNEDSRGGRKETRSCESSSRTPDDKYRRTTSKLTSEDLEHGSKNKDLSRQQMHAEKNSKRERHHESRSAKPIRSPDCRQASRCSSTLELTSSSKETDYSKERTRADAVDNKRDEKRKEKSLSSSTSADKSDQDRGRQRKPYDKEVERNCLKAKSPNLWTRSPRKGSLRSPYKSDKGHRSKDADHKKEKKGEQQRDGKGRHSSSSGKGHKHDTAKEIINKEEKRDRHHKSEMHRSEESRKKERETHKETNPRTGKREVTPENKDAEKETRSSLDDTRKRGISSETKIQEAPACEQKDSSARKVQEGLKEPSTSEFKSPDSKLCFMAKLNLTISPVKKQTCTVVDSDVPKTVNPKSDDGKRDEEPVDKGNFASLRPGNEISSTSLLDAVESSTAVTSGDCLKQTMLQSKEPALLNQTGLVPQPPTSETLEETGAPVSVEHALVGFNHSATPFEVILSQAVANGRDAAENQTSTNLNIDVSFVADTASVSGCVDLEMEFETLYEPMESLSLKDKSDQWVEVNATMPSIEIESLTTPTKQDIPVKLAVTEGISKDKLDASEPAVRDVVAVLDDACSFEPKGIDSKVNSFVCEDDPSAMETMSTRIGAHFLEDDDASVLSVDLNHMRNIPPVISPLTSPVRPVRKVLSLESPIKPTVVRTLNKDLSTKEVDPKNASSTKNKENQEPVSKPDGMLVESEDSSVEEGEILSDDEKSEQWINPSATVQKLKPKDEKPSVSPSSGKLEKGKSSKDEVKSPARKIHRGKRSFSSASKEGCKSPRKEKSPRISQSTLLHLMSINLFPSSIPEVMEILSSTRREVRKKYMKYQKQFPEQRYRTHVEVSILEFTTLINKLNLSKISKSASQLQEVLCETIKTKLNMIKRSSAVNCIFEQQAPNMKKRLWRIMEQSLDSLFEQLHQTLVKFYDAGSKGKEQFAKRKLKIVSEKGKECAGSGKTFIEKGRSLNSASPHISSKTLRSPQIKMAGEKQKHSKDETGKINKNMKLSPTLKSLPKKLHNRLQVQDSLPKGSAAASNQKGIFSSLADGQVGSFPAKEALGIKEPKLEKQKLSKDETRKMNKSKMVSQILRSTPVKVCDQLQIKDDLRDKSVAANNLKGNLSCSTDGLMESSPRKEAFDKPDKIFEILTEQQTSSLTFNLVSDTQMGEIFKRLLHGSDLLEMGVSGLERSDFTIDTPEKQNPASQCNLSIQSCVSTPEKTSEASDLVAFMPWPSLLEKHLASPVSLAPPLNPDVLDENCMLEIPSLVEKNQDCLCSEGKPRPLMHSVLLEDLAVSLTVPSPLKSDAHLSFLRPVDEKSLLEAVPQNIVTAHYSEDAVLDEEDASEQDIHLALDSDNSSGHSNSSSRWVSQEANPGFQYQPNLPMQAVVMEKSNDHFIVKIRRASTSTSQSLKISDGPSPPTGRGKDIRNLYLDLHLDEKIAFEETVVEHSENFKDTDSVDDEVTGPHSETFSFGPDNTSSNRVPEATLPPPETNSKEDERVEEEASVTPDTTEVAQNCLPVALTSSESNAPPDLPKNSSSNKKRKKEHAGGSSSKLSKSESAPENESKKSKARSDGGGSSKRRRLEEGTLIAKKKSSSKPSEKTKEGPFCRSTTPSPNSLSAKNLIKKKGEVVMTWTREQDRMILLECQRQEPSEKTFVFLAEGLKKTPHQVLERFHQLMKLFKMAKSMNS
ncbi:CASP8-associated protein 2 [Latimeria chalumnae]|uniref:CASP8-associated protein 2 n=1 Tax=Latimeria chalumnae TaxID=7897 RepID=UPI00313F297B